MSVRLYVGNLPKEPIERQALQEVFADAGQITTKVIKDRKTGKCRGFAFVTVPTDEAADEFIDKFNGQSFMDSTLKIEKALPRTKGKGKEEGEGEGEGESVSAKPTPAPTLANGNSTASAGNAKTPKKGGGGKKRSRPQSAGGTSSTQGDSFQPDPRWAGKLAELKERLAAQASS